MNVHFIHSDLFQNIEKQYDIVVSNPPYITSEEIKKLQKEVKQEPLLALDGGKDGLSFYRRIARESKKHLVPNGWIALEIGYQQGETVPAIVQAEGYEAIEVKKDFSGNDRVVIAQRR